MALDFVSVADKGTTVDLRLESDVPRVARERPIDKSVAIHRIELVHIPIEIQSADCSCIAEDFVTPAFRSTLALGLWRAKVK
jgi:hypothetical protein